MTPTSAQFLAFTIAMRLGRRPRTGQLYELCNVNELTQTTKKVVISSNIHKVYSPLRFGKACVKKSRAS